MLPEAIAVAACMAGALVVRPWRALPPSGPPWVWLVWWAVIPLFWTVDRLSHISVVQPISGACLLTLLCGWPIAVFALLPVAALTWVTGELNAAMALQRLVWLGLVPATLTMALGVVVRRWLPRNLFSYIFGRAFFGTALATMASTAAWLWLRGEPSGGAMADLLLARWLAAWTDAVLTGMLAAVFVAFRPEWLATYEDRIYME